MSRLTVCIQYSSITLDFDINLVSTQATHGTVNFGSLWVELRSQITNTLVSPDFHRHPERLVTSTCSKVHTHFDRTLDISILGFTTFLEDLHFIRHISISTYTKDMLQSSIIYSGHGLHSIYHTLINGVVVLHSFADTSS